MFGSSAPFGSSSGGFGQQNNTPAFGAPAAPFGGGGGGGFGTQPSFGTPAPAAGGFGGGFGSPAPAPAFGGGNTFGAPAPAPSAFGSAGGGFGSGMQSSSPFGAPAPAPTGGMFGSAPTPSGGLFGSSTSSTPGGFSTGNGGFGGGGGGFGTAPTPAPAFGSTFGSPAPAPSTGLFGAPAPSTFGSTNNAFGATSSSSTFGAPAPTGGMFGATTPAAPAGGMFGTAPGGASGTKLTPFAVTSKQDGSTTINLQSISAMAQYEQKSFEELRFEDYSQGNRGTGNAAAGNTGGFGGFGAASPAPSSGLFATPAQGSSTFGAPAPTPGGFSGFGSPPAPSSGFGTTGAFGAPAPAFGAPAPATFSTPAPAPGGFGTAAFGAPAPSTGLFGAPAPAPTGGLFGSSAPAPGGLFGSTPAAAPAFGAPAPPTGGLFGTPAPAPTTGLFGTPAPAAFGAPSPATFGGSAPSTFGGFGSPAPAPAGGLFGTPAPAPFGAPTSGGLFGTPAPASGSIFGAPAPSTFGTPAPSGGVFGQPAPASTGVFGAPATSVAPQLVAAPPVGSIMPPATNEILTAQLTALENKRKEIEKSDNFRTKTIESSSVNGISLSESESLKSLTPLRTSFPPYHVSPRSTAKIRPRGFASPEKGTTSLSALGTGGRPMAAPDSSAVASTTRLVIKPSPKPRIKLSLEPVSQNSVSISKNKNSPAQVSGASALSGGTNAQDGSANKGDTTLSTECTMVNSVRNSERNDIQDPEPPREKSKFGLPAKRKVAPSLSKEGYICTPTVEALEGMPPEDLATVQGFSVERPGVGKIEWEGAVDVRGLNLDTVVVIDDSPQSASVYTQEEKDGTKPPVGTKLNRPAIITLESVFPPEGIPKERFEKRVAKSTKRNHAELISYDSSSGKWTFRVLHFSRYALTDDDSESEDETEHHFESGERGGRSPAGGGVGSTSNQAELLQYIANESPSKGVLVKAETGEFVTKSQLDLALLDARKTFEDFEAEWKQGTHHGSVMNRTSETSAFFEESKVEDGWKMTTRYIPTTQAINSVRRTRRAVCANIAQANVKTSSIDFGFRMGRSFRVGWSPDGSFMAFGPLGTLSRRKPVFSRQSTHEETLLQQHRENAKKLRNSSLSGCPQFHLPSFESDEAALKKAFKSYKGMKVGGDKNQLIQVAKMAFSLLGYLVENLDGRLENVTWKARSSLEARRIHAITCWLVDSCAEEVDEEIDLCMSQGKKLAALLAAVTGGDRDKACNLASDLGFFQLSTILAARDASKNDMLRQALCWTDSATSPSLSEDFLRISFLVAGDSKMEQDIYRKKYSPYDWRRRLAIFLVYGGLDQDPTLSATIAAYEEKVKTGVAPYPQPRYLQGTSMKEMHCVLYRLLRLGESGRVASLIDTVYPLGYSDSEHDYSLAFHLSSAISAMQYSLPLTPIEMASLIDSYTAQLLTSGMWEWAVYVSLCSLCPSDGNILSLTRAKSLVLQNYMGATSECRRRREFLEFVGVPSKWFEEALALRCAIGGDSHGHLCHMVLVSDEDTVAALEKVLIPKMFFMNMEELAKALKLLEVFAREEDSLAFAVYNFFQLSQSISALDGASQAEIESTVPSLSETCNRIEQVLESYKPDSTTKQRSSLRFSPDVVPFASFLAEAMSQLSLFKLQLKALQSEIQISSSVSQILSLAQPKGHEINQLGISDRESICKWLL